jgi:hypothetical protein
MGTAENDAFHEEIHLSWGGGRKQACRGFLAFPRGVQAPGEQIEDRGEVRHDEELLSAPASDRLMI